MQNAEACDEPEDPMRMNAGVSAPGAHLNRARHQQLKGAPFRAAAECGVSTDRVQRGAAASQVRSSCNTANGYGLEICA